jgi:pseudouridine-5'-phosphate glycosidase
MYPPPPLDVRPNLAADIQAGRPVVAFTSAPLAHSLPWPDNLEVSRLADASGIRVKDRPTFILERLNRLTKGRALRAYKAILEANACLAAQVAREICDGSRKIGDQAGRGHEG